MSPKAVSQDGFFFQRSTQWLSPRNPPVAAIRCLVALYQVIKRLPLLPISQISRSPTCQSDRHFPGEDFPHTTRPAFAYFPALLLTRWSMFGKPPDANSAKPICSAIPAARATHSRETHHAAPASGSRYAIDSQFARSVRRLADRFEHWLFLSATPHNCHSNSFSALLEILDPNSFDRSCR
jgi:hypothetical protein